MKLLWLVACLWTGMAQAQMMAEPLMPEKAFRFSADMIDAQTIAVRWEIAPGYYMYRDKFSFTVEPAPAALGKFELPRGIVKEDPTFGRVETYRDEAHMQLPLSGAHSAITLRATSQGCADMGICYPPQKHSIVLQVPAPLIKPPDAGQTGDSRIETWRQSDLLWPALLGMAGLVLVIFVRTRAWKWIGVELILVAIALAMFMRFLSAHSLN